MRSEFWSSATGTPCCVVRVGTSPPAIWCVSPPSPRTTIASPSWAGLPLAAIDRALRLLLAIPFSRPIATNRVGFGGTNTELNKPLRDDRLLGAVPARHLHVPGFEPGPF